MQIKTRLNDYADTKNKVGSRKFKPLSDKEKNKYLFEENSNYYWLIPNEVLKCGDCNLRFYCNLNVNIYALSKDKKGFRLSCTDYDLKQCKDRKLILEKILENKILKLYRLENGFESD